MIKFYDRYLIFFLISLSISLPSSAQIPFSKGVNLTGWFQASSARQIQFSKFKKKDFQNIKSLGCDVIRLPINLHAMTNGQPDYTIDTLFLKFLDQAVDWAEELQIHLILDNHTFNPAAKTDPAIGTPLIKVWTQMAKHFKNRSDYIYYEILNEPHGIDDALWNNIQQSVIDAIRTEDTRHFIVVGPANWNSFRNLKNLPIYTDTKLIYTFHFYDPFIFTHQGASWVNPSMVPLAGVPFPYRSSEMPLTPISLKGTWIESAINNYRIEGTTARVKQLIDIAFDFKNQHKVPVFCGEFGVFIPNSPENDRVAWYELVRSYLNEKGIPWTIWDFTGGFGLFEKNSPEFFDYDLNVPLLHALAFTVPPQDEYFQRPLTRGFKIYGDDFGDDIINASASNEGILDFYSASKPQEGIYSIYWTGVSQYAAISFNFKRHLDLSLLKENDHTLEFFVRGNSATAKFDVRFIDSKKSATDHPWRMGKTIENIPADNQWYPVKIPLKELVEKGAWDNAWFPPQGKQFEWTSVDRFEIVPEHQPLNGIEFSFDYIRIQGEEVIVTGLEEKINLLNFSVYPNPLNENTRVEFTALTPGPMTIGVYNLQGQKVKCLIQEVVLTGHHVVQWNGTDDSGRHLPSGLYFIRMESAKTSEFLKVLVGE